jgi:thioredoxin reductase (NADPH)
MRDVERELRDRYARHYRVVCMRSPREVLARLEELAPESEQVALVLAGQRLSGMTGSELLDQARHLHPHAKRGLLMAWDSLGDRAAGEAIFDSIARGWIDHYVVRPAEPSVPFGGTKRSASAVNWDAPAGTGSPASRATASSHRRLPTPGCPARASPCPILSRQAKITRLRG